MRHVATNLSSPQERERDRGWIHETCGHEFVITTGEREIEGGSMRRVATNLSSPQDRERDRGWIHETHGHEFVITTGQRER